MISNLIAVSNIMLSAILVKNVSTQILFLFLAMFCKFMAFKGLVWLTGQMLLKMQIRLPAIGENDFNNNGGIPLFFEDQAPAWTEVEQNLFEWEIIEPGRVKFAFRHRKFFTLLFWKPIYLSSLYIMVRTMNFY